MNCPIDNNLLSITHRDNIEIDYCPKCRGVWLDRGELDKIIEKNTISHRDTPKDNHYSKDQHYQSYDHDSHYSKKKKGSFLEDIFDF